MISSSQRTLHSLYSLSTATASLIMPQQHTTQRVCTRPGTASLDSPVSRLIIVETSSRRCSLSSNSSSLQASQLRSIRNVPNKVIFQMMNTCKS